jgi:hypothetical protein
MEMAVELNKNAPHKSPRATDVRPRGGITKFAHAEEMTVM